MMMAPDAKIDDGLMDIVVAKKMSRLSLLSSLPGIYKGKHLNHPSIRVFKAKQAKINTRPVKTMLPDGEIFGMTPSTITVLPKRVRYL